MKTEIKLKTVKRQIIEQVPINYWIVSFDTIWGSQCNSGKHDDCLEHGCMDNEPSYIAEIEPRLERITTKNYITLDYNYAIKTMNSSEYIGDDTHDLRPRLFKTKGEAQKFIDYTVNRFNNPNPWECFVKQ